MLKISVELDCVIEIQAEPKEIEQHITELAKLNVSRAGKLKTKLLQAEPEEIEENIPESVEKLKTAKASKLKAKKLQEEQEENM